MESTQALALRTGDALDMYHPTGHLKHMRVFWVELGDVCVCWGKKRDSKTFKREKLTSIGDAPKIKSARQWFDSFDIDGSGEIDGEELRQLYRQARGKKLSKKDLKTAMAAMDSDGDGTVSFSEFEHWWTANGGGLEAYRDRALTIGAGDAHLLLVAPDLVTKARWITGCRELLGESGPEPVPEREPAPPPRVRMNDRGVLPLPMLVVPSKQARNELFAALDVNGNGGLSLAEIDKGVVSGIFAKVLSSDGCATGESFNHKPALMRAYHAADRSRDGFIQRSEFVKLLQYMVYFNNMWHKFEAIDSDHDRRLDLAEFAAGCKIVGLEIRPEEAEAEFTRCDADGGGMILFGEFCAWCAARHISGVELENEQMEGDVGEISDPGVCISADEDLDAPSAIPEPEPESPQGIRVQLFGDERSSPMAASRKKKKMKKKKKKSSEHLPWEDSRLAEQTDAKRKVQAVPRNAELRLPPKLRPISASTIHSPGSRRNSQGEAADKANERRRARANRIKHQPRSTIYDREKEPHDYWSQVRARRARLVAENGYAMSEASFATATEENGLAGSGGQCETVHQGVGGSTTKWHLGLSSLSPEELPSKDAFDNALPLSPARAMPSHGFSKKTTPNRAPTTRLAMETETVEAAGARAEMGTGTAVAVDASFRSASPESNVDALGLRRLSSASGMGSPRDRDLKRRLDDHGTTSHEREEIRTQRVTAREQLRRAWKSLSYTPNGQDPWKLLDRFDTDSNGVLDELEFRNAVRKGGQITAKMMSDKSVLQLFYAINAGGDGGVTVEELTSFLWETDLSGASRPGSPQDGKASIRMSVSIDT